MNYNIIKEYIDFIKKSFLELFKIVLEDNYDKEYCSLFIDRYINVRYYNDTNYPKEKDFTKRLNKEMLDLINDIITEDNVEVLKNITALFAYIEYFDDITYVKDEVKLLESIINDNYVKIEDTKELKKVIKAWYIEFKKKKETFNDTVVTKNFKLIEEKIYRRIYYLNLVYDIRISNLFSEYAINKAYTSGTVNEDKLFVTYILASYLVLSNAFNLDFSRKYVIPFAGTLLSKEKKLARLMGVIDNPLAKEYLAIRLNYKDYEKNRDIVNKYISKGYYFAIELDDSFKGNITELMLFPYILLYDDCEDYDYIISKKDELNSKIVLM